MTSTCAFCGEPFQPDRRTARFCGTNCRVKAHYRRRKAAKPAGLAAELQRAGISGAFPYIGSKGSSSGPALMELLRAAGGDQCSRWVEPFVGSAAAYLSAIRAGLADPARAVLNDRCRWILSTMRAIRDEPAALAQRLRRTPISTEPFTREPGPDWDDVAIACWWLGRNWGGFVGAYSSSRLTVDHSRGNSRVRRWLALPDRLELLSKCFVGPYLLQQDALSFLQRVCRPGDLVFCDPPYVGTERLYAAGDWNAHRELAELLQVVPATLVAVCYVDCELVRDLYPESRWIWHQLERPTSSARARPGQPRQYRQELLLIRR